MIALGSRPDEPVPVFVGDEPKYLGWPCIGASGRNAVEVAEPLPRERQYRYRRSQV